jgi:hypothetical protein
MIISIGNCFSQQSEKETSENINTLAVNFFGSSPYAGFTYERRISSIQSLEAGLGIGGFSLGTKFYPNVLLNEKYVFITGLTLGALSMVKPYYFIYIPFGAVYDIQKNTFFSFDLGPAFFRNYKEKDSYIYPYGTLKLGYRF